MLNWVQITGPREEELVKDLLKKMDPEYGPETGWTKKGIYRTQWIFKGQSW